MIKIIKHGNKRVQHTPWKGHCFNCGCVFASDDNHVYFAPGVGHTHRMVKCPDCNHPGEVHNSPDEFDEKMKVLEELKSAMESFHSAVFKVLEKIK
jgi:hypothetical protein